MEKALTVSALLFLRSKKPVQLKLCIDYKDKPMQLKLCIDYKDKPMQLKLCIDYKDEPMNTRVLHRLKRRLASVIFRAMKVGKQ